MSNQRWTAIRCHWLLYNTQTSPNAGFRFLRCSPRPLLQPPSVVGYLWVFLPLVWSSVTEKRALLGWDQVTDFEKLLCCFSSTGQYPCTLQSFVKLLLQHLPESEQRVEHSTEIQCGYHSIYCSQKYCCRFLACWTSRLLQASDLCRAVYNKAGSEFI